MKSLRKILLCSAIVVAATVSGGAAFAQNVADASSSVPMKIVPLTIDRIAADPDLWSLTISRDGKHIAGLAGIDGQNPVVRIWDTSDLSKPPVQFGSRLMRFMQISFVKNDRLMIVANQPVQMGGALLGDGATGSRWVTKLAFSDLEGKKFDEFRAQFSGLQVLSTLPSDPDNILVEATSDVDEISGALKFNTRTMAFQRVARIDEDASFSVASDPNDTTGLGASGIVDAAGNLRMKRTLETRGGEYFDTYYWREVGGEWRELKAFTNNIKDRFTVDIVTMSEDGHTLMVETNRNSNFKQIYNYNVLTDSFSAPLFANTDYDSSGAVFWRPQDEATTNVTDDSPTGFCWSGPARECQYTDPTLLRLQTLAESALPGKIVSIRARQSGAVTMITAHGPNTPVEYYILKNEQQLVRIGSNMENVDRSTLGSGQWVVYKARDGLDIPGILFLPSGYDKARDGRIPLVVMPHGGPWGADDLSWDRSNWPQMFATRGFAVLQPNYRGSDGYGMNLWKAGDKEWGAKMQNDNDDGARWLVEQGIADPNRMMLYGYSYGGFAAAAAAARSGSESKGLWQCAISGAPAIDIERISNDWGANRASRIRQGSTVAGWDPAKHLDEVEIPWLIFHGDYDRQADTIHSRDAASKMRGNSKALFRYEEIPQMSHQLVQMTVPHRRFFTSLMFDWVSNDCGNISAQYDEPGATPIYRSTKRELKVRTVENRPGRR